MSYILDALKKAEKQREIGQVPGIGSVHDARDRGRGRRWQWVSAISLILIVNAVILGAIFWPVHDVQDTRVPARSAPPVEGVQRPSEPPPGPPESTPVARPRAPKVPAGDASTVQPIADARPLPPLPGPPAAEARPLKPLPLPRDLPLAPQAAGSEAPSADPPPVPRSPTAPQSPSQELPVWPLVEDELFHQINAKLNVDVHVYNRIPEKRFVFLNMNIYHEGDRLVEGPELEEITQDGVVLSFRGERFRVPAR